MRSTSLNNKQDEAIAHFSPLTNSAATSDDQTVPLAQLAFDRFSLLAELPKTSYHQINKVINLDSQHVNYFKKNLAGSVVSEIEAAIAAFYAFLAPDQVPQTHAVYNQDKETIGVVSAEIPFVTVANDPLHDDDMTVDHLAERNLFASLDQFDKDFISIQKSENNAQALEDFYERLLQTLQVTQNDFRKFRIVKGLAIGLTTSFIFIEDDLHRNNMTKDGKRVDFDMSLWPILFDHKDLGFFNRLIRKPNEKFLLVTKEDIDNFPNLHHAIPFHWPALTPNLIRQSSTALIGMVVPTSGGSANHFSAEEAAVYRKLANNKVFMHYKNAIMFKYVLSNETIYRNLALLHIRKDRQSLGRSVVNELAQFQAQRIQRFKDVLVTVPQFAAFVSEHGERWLADMVAEFTLRNEKYLQAPVLAKIDETIDNLISQHKNLFEINQNLLHTATIESHEPTDAQVNLAASIIEDPEQTAKPTNLLMHALEDFYAQEAKDTAALQATEEDALKRMTHCENESTMKNLAKIIHQKRMEKVDYLRQEINIDDIRKAYVILKEKLSAMPAEPETTQALHALSGAQTAITPERPSLPLHPPTPASGGLYTYVTDNFSSFAQGIWSVLPAVVTTQVADRIVSFQQVKKATLEAMASYQSVSFWNTRTNIAAAKEIENFCLALQPDEHDKQACHDAIDALQAKLTRVMGTKKDGKFKTTLANLLAQPIWPERVAVDANQLSHKG